MSVHAHPRVRFTLPLLPPSLPPSLSPPPPTTARLVNEDDPWAQEPGFLAEVMVAAYERRRSQVRVWVGGRCGRWDSAAAGGGRPFHALCTLLPCLQADAISEMPLYPTEAVLFDENQVPSMHYTGRCTGAARAVAGGLCGRWWFMEAVRARMTPACMPAGPPPSLSTSRNPRQAPLPTPPPPPPPPTHPHPPTHTPTPTHTFLRRHPCRRGRACAPQAQPAVSLQEEGHGRTTSSRSIKHLPGRQREGRARTSVPPAVAQTRRGADPPFACAAVLQPLLALYDVTV